MAYIMTDTALRPLISGASLVKTVALWVNAARERRALSRLSAAQLDDIGIDARSADQEISRPFWDVTNRS